MAAYKPVVKNGKFYHYYPATPTSPERWVYIRPASTSEPATTGGIDAWRNPIGATQESEAIRAATQPGQTPPPPPPPPAAAPTAPAGSGAAPPQRQFDAGVEQKILGINTGLTATLGDIEAQRKRAAQNYGFQLGTDQIGDETIDFSDPASKAALLQRHWMEAKAGTTTSYGAMGQSTSGAFQRAQKRNNELESIGYSQLGREFQGLLGGLSSSEVQARGQAAGQTGDILFWLAQQQANPANAQAEAPLPGQLPTTGAQVPAWLASLPYQRIVGNDSKGNPGYWHVYPDGRKVFVPHKG